jgi:hypothetical protein
MATDEGYSDIDLPYVMSFSGGRTSAFMLRRVLDGVGLPSGCHVVFANTGKEHPATLEFVDEVSHRWGVPITWVERRYREDPGFNVVTSATASRAGEPFAQLIRAKKYLPNPITRFCTEELKVRSIAMYAKSVGVTDGTMLVGLRADEPRRVHRVQGDERNGFAYDCPMYRHGHTLSDVTAFWKSQPFDLRLPNDDRAFGNCDLCFLKGRGILERVIRHDPTIAQWWIDQENAIGAKFRSDMPSFSQMLVQVRIQPQLFGEEGDDDIIPCTCTD